MASIQVKSSSGEIKHIDISEGWTLMETLREHGYDEILAMCGGCCSCATCHVYLDASNCATPPEMEEDEALLLEMEDSYKVDASRLSCQIELNDSFDGLQVTIISQD